MKKISNILWGIVLVVLGIIFCLNALEITNISLFFDGWWTLFIIIPCAVGLFTNSEKTGDIIGLFIGVGLLLACQNIIDFDMLWKLFVPVIIIIIGIKLIFKDVIKNRTAKLLDKKRIAGGEPLKQYCATFSGQNLSFEGEAFDGVDLTAVFGGIKCDLTHAMIKDDAVINICSVFGGIDVYLPENVTVKIYSSSIFGGVSNKKNKHSDTDAITVYINANCIFGGADIK